jgi:hypothetical protein
VARLQHELDQAKIDDLSTQLAAAEAAAGGPTTPTDPATGAAVPPPPRHTQVFNLDPGQPIRLNLNEPGGGYQQGSFGQRPRLTKQTHADGPPLAPGPRKVPWQFKAVVMPWSWWTVFTIFMVSITPIAAWVYSPLAGAIAVALTFLVIVALRVRKDRLQLSLLKWGEPANVINAEEVSVGTYYSGVTYSNVRMAQAHGWEVERKWYSGPGTSTKITYEINGTQATMGLHGLAYDDGVILADPRKPEHALCISSFAYDLDRDNSGNWIGKLPGRVVFGAVAMTALLVAWTAGLITLFVLQALSLHGWARPT